MDGHADRMIIRPTEIWTYRQNESIAISQVHSIIDRQRRVWKRKMGGREREREPDHCSRMPLTESSADTQTQSPGEDRQTGRSQRNDFMSLVSESRMRYSSVSYI